MRENVAKIHRNILSWHCLRDLRKGLLKKRELVFFFEDPLKIQDKW